MDFLFVIFSVKLSDSILKKIQAIYFSEILSFQKKEHSRYGKKGVLIMSGDSTLKEQETFFESFLKENIIIIVWLD